MTESGETGHVTERDLAERIDALRDEHCYIPSVDVCAHCGDSECDGIGCIAGIDPDAAGAGDAYHYEALDNLHALLREGRAWRIMHALLAEGEVEAALMLSMEALAVANNQTIHEDCDTCGHWFPAQGPCDTTCTACRLTALSERGEATDG